MNDRYLPQILMNFCLSFALVSCGNSNKNVFSSYESEDVAAEATHEMEAGNPSKAIRILEKALESDADNYQLISILSAAYAQLYGVDLIDIVTNIANPSNNRDSRSNSELAAMWPFIPEASNENIDGVEYSVTLLRSIPLAARTDADHFKLGILSTVLVSIQLKALDLNGDGELSAQELIALSEDDARALLSGLLGSIESLAAMQSGFGDESNKSSEKISEIYSEIETAEGDTDAERLAKYLSSTSE